MTSCTKGNLNKGSLLNIHLASSKIAYEKLGYTVKLQEAVQSSNAKYLQRFQAAVPPNEGIHKEVAE